jgi:hypothetical protein
MDSVLVLKLGVTKVVIRVMLTVGHKPRVDWTFLRTYSLQNYFPKSFSFILFFVLLMLFKSLSYSLLFLNFRWIILAAQPARARDISPLVRWHQGMCHLSRSHNPTLISTFLRRRIPLRLWSGYMREKICKKLNSYHRTTTMATTTRMSRKKKTKRLTKKEATMENMKMMRTTLL